MGLCSLAAPVRACVVAILVMGVGTQCIGSVGASPTQQAVPYTALSFASVLASPTQQTVSYTVRAGDTLTTVAARYQTTVAAVQKANHLGTKTVITVGQHLMVPLPLDWGYVPQRLRAYPDRLALIPVFDKWAKQNAIPADLLKATTYLESGWNNKKVSSTGAIGIGQLMPDTAAFIERDLIGMDLDPTRAQDNIRMSARYLRFLLRGAEGNVSLALMRYYQGYGSLQRNGAYPQTKQYARDVVALRRQFRK